MVSSEYHANLISRVPKIMQSFLLDIDDFQDYFDFFLESDDDPNSRNRVFFQSFRRWLLHITQQLCFFRQFLPFSRAWWRKLSNLWDAFSYVGTQVIVFCQKKASKELQQSGTHLLREMIDVDDSTDVCLSLRRLIFSSGHMPAI